MKKIVNYIINLIGLRRPGQTWVMLTAAGQRAALFSLLWWVLTAGERDAWLFGVPVVLGTTVVSTALMPPTNWRLRMVGLARFLPYFLWYSLTASIDVAWRSLHPQLPIDPIFWEYPLRLPRKGPMRVFFVNALTLLPGTLGAELRSESVLVHAIDRRSEVVEKLERLETLVSNLFAQT